MGVKNFIKAVPMTTFSSASLSGTYQAINPLGLPEPCFLLKINNFGTSSTIITISYDGINDHDQVNANSFMEVYGGWGSSQPSNNTCLWAKGQIVYIKGTAGTGTIGLVGYYQPNQNTIL